VSFLTKLPLKSELKALPANWTCLIEISPAQIILKNIIATIEDFQAHAQLKNITVEVKKAPINHCMRSFKKKKPCTMMLLIK
jgi:hypothetical protein